MSLDTYANLQTEIGEFTNRSDLSAKFPTFIALAEAEMRRRLRRSSRRETITVSSLATILPCAATELRSIYPVTGSPELDLPLEICTPEMLAEARAGWGGSTGRPTKAAITSSGRELLVSPTPDATYNMEVIYFIAVQALSTTNTVNDELREAPDMYLYGALAAAEAYLENDERIPLWKAKFDEAIEQQNVRRTREEFGASLRPVRIRVMG